MISRWFNGLGLSRLLSARLPAVPACRECARTMGEIHASDCSREGSVDRRATLPAPPAPLRPSPNKDWYPADEDQAEQP